MKKIAVVGVNNNQGREFLNILEESGFSAEEVMAVDTDSPLGTQVSYGEDVDMDVFDLRDFDFSAVKLAVFCTSGEVAKRYIPQATAKSVMVIDCSSTVQSSIRRLKWTSFLPFKLTDHTPFSYVPS